MRFILYILSILSATLSLGKISTSDLDKERELVDNFQEHIDSTRQLLNDANIYYISDTLFEVMLLELGSGRKIELECRYKVDSRGYTKFEADYEKFILLKQRGDGSGNPEEFRLINKQTGEEKWFDNFPVEIAGITDTLNGTWLLSHTIRYENNDTIIQKYSYQLWNNPGAKPWTEIIIDDLNVQIEQACMKCPHLYWEGYYKIKIKKSNGHKKSYLNFIDKRSLSNIEFESDIKQFSGQFFKQGDILEIIDDEGRKWVYKRKNG